MDNIEQIKKPRYTEAQKRSYSKYYTNNKKELRDKQKEYYDTIKDTEEFKLRRKEYNRSFKERKALANPDKPKRPGGRPRTLIINRINTNNTDFTTSESSNDISSNDSLSVILKQFPIIPSEILLI